MAVHGKVVIEKYNNIPLHATDPSEWVIVENTHMESFDREKIQKVIKKVIINGEDNIEIVWNTDDPFFK